MILDDYVRYNRERATIEIERETVISLRGKLMAMLDTILGVRQIAIATQGARLVIVYTTDGIEGYDRLYTQGNYWERVHKDSIIWHNWDTGEDGIQLII